MRPTSWYYNLGERTHTLDPRWMPKPLPPRNKCTSGFAPAMVLPCVPSYFNPISHPRLLSPMNGVNEEINWLVNIWRSIYVAHWLKWSKAYQYWIGCVAFVVTWCMFELSREVTESCPWREGRMIMALLFWHSELTLRISGRYWHSLMKHRCQHLVLGHVNNLVLDTYRVWPTWKWSNTINDVNGNDKVVSSCSWKWLLD